MIRPVENILSRADGVKRTAPGRWMCKCPLVPSQKTGSVSVRELDDGRVLLHDFAGHDTTDILTAWGLEMGDLFPEALTAHDSPCKPIRRPWLGRDALSALERETWLVIGVLEDVAEGRTPPAEVMDYARRSAYRLRAALEVCHGV
ncbi:hypothetical protein [Ectothiorhodospira variabilis]|uniref:hypothetical protein n=1 Tax=Ectothiorhodospira variabilis TaxID=505694 RepID=UPI001EFBA814|nr:hypothetical protein [Ectothiorhodospira variabilis]MCG5495640.1 hypothetical protein [Ectothiorhodospira variabilis]MCG5504701.1 hypothetical protein [Ectothiorhodospira variabilis]MCG5507858.1 hypothetical protein [Ectothiorhodospira variabilis]